MVFVACRYPSDRRFPSPVGGMEGRGSRMLKEGAEHIQIVGTRDDTSANKPATDT
jgi:hypothetical protein